MQLNTSGLSAGSLVFRGIIGLIFGIFILLKPGLSLASFILFFAAFAFISGILTVLNALTHKKVSQNWAAILFEGIIGIVVGVFLLAWPGISLMFLLYVVAFWVIFSGFFRLIAAVKLRKVIQNEFWLIFNAIVSIVFGIFILFYPGATLVGLTWLIGFYAVFYGVVNLGLAWKVRAK